LILNAHPALYTRPLTDIFFSVDKSDFSNFFGRYLYESGWARFGPFAIGLLLAHIYVHSKENMTKLFSNTVVTHVLRLLALVFILLPLTLPIHHPQSWYYNAFSTELNFWVLAASRQVFALGLFLLILGCWFAPREFILYNKLFKLPFWRPISRLSFPIYLLHFPMIAVAAVLIKGTTDIKLIGSFSFLDAVLVFILAFALTILISLPLHIWVERTAIDYFKKKSRSRVHASVD
jgi:peptidoglycan/LPS O-acetylase OafA/YrhL